MKKKAALLALALFIVGWPGKTGAEPANLQRTIDEAPANSEVRLAAGTYKGPLVIDKPITIIGGKGVVIDGQKNGTVITVEADHVSISGLTIKKSGKGAQEAGLLLKKVKQAKIKNNSFDNVQYGIYIRGGGRHVITGNTISSYTGHFSTRGNGIHLLSTNENKLTNNTIKQVQDGVYIDDSSDNLLKGNRISDSRYALHFMFSAQNRAESNQLSNNITGIMAMNSNGIQIEENRLEQHVNYRGYGVLIYETEDVQLLRNKVLYNHNGLSLQTAKAVLMEENEIAGNYIGITTEGENRKIQMRKNRMEGNLIQTKLSGQPFFLDDGQSGNYWDDYRSYDLDGDGIGEVPYKSASGYSQLLYRYPHLQFYFESPAMHVWQSVEKLFSLKGEEDGTDRYPLVTNVRKEAPSYMNLLFICAGAAGGLLYFIQQRRRRET